MEKSLKVLNGTILPTEDSLEKKEEKTHKNDAKR